MGKTYPRVTELLKKEFEEKGVSKYAFCKRTGINPTSVERYLCGISEPNQGSLEKLSDYFKVSVAWLRGATPWTLDDEELIYDLDQKYFAGDPPSIKYNPRQSFQHLRQWMVSYKIIYEKQADAAGIVEMESLRNDIFKYFLLCAVFLNHTPEERKEALEVLNHFNEKISYVAKATNLLNSELTPAPGEEG